MRTARNPPKSPPPDAGGVLTAIAIAMTMKMAVEKVTETKTNRAAVHAARFSEAAEKHPRRNVSDDDRSSCYSSEKKTASRRCDRFKRKRDAISSTGRWVWRR